jgi:hypothetical protein
VLWVRIECHQRRRIRCHDFPQHESRRFENGKVARCFHCAPREVCLDTSCIARPEPVKRAFPLQIDVCAKIIAVTLYRPVGPAELKLIEASGWREFPPRLPEQPIFYPVLNEEYAVQIARDWNVKDSGSGSGFVTRFAIAADVFAKYKVQTVGGQLHKELWVPAEELPAFNQSIVGKIEVIAEFVDRRHYWYLSV